jgi:hypothetical protein
MPPLEKMETILAADYPQMPPSVKKETMLVADYPQMPPTEKMETILVAHYPQMPLSVKNGEITGSTLSPNATIAEKRRQYW